MSYNGDGLDLLPPNASNQEREIALTLSRLSDIEESLSNSPVMPAVAAGQSTPLGASTAGDAIRNLWSVSNCPSSLLPWFAWAFSVGTWSSLWTDTQKRAVISNAVYIHKHKGTIGAVNAVVASFGAGFAVREWWETSPMGSPYTFTLNIALSLIPAGLQQSIVDAISAVKPVRATMFVNFVAGYLAPANALAVTQATTFQRFSASLN